MHRIWSWRLLGAPTILGCWMEAARHRCKAQGLSLSWGNPAWVAGWLLLELSCSRCCSSDWQRQAQRGDFSSHPRCVEIKRRRKLLVSSDGEPSSAEVDSPINQVLHVNVVVGVESTIVWIECQPFNTTCVNKWMHILGVWIHWDNSCVDVDESK